MRMFCFKPALNSKGFQQGLRLDTGPKALTRAFFRGKRGGPTSAKKIDPNNAPALVQPALAAINFVTCAACCSPGHTPCPAAGPPGLASLPVTF